MIKLDFRAVTALPAVLTPNTFYFVQNGTYAESYLTTLDGTLHSIGNSQMVQDTVRTEVHEYYKDTLEIVEDIPARDALSVEATGSLIVTVVDATDDPNVDEGGALYAYDYRTSEWHLLTAYGTIGSTRWTEEEW